MKQEEVKFHTMKDFHLRLKENSNLMIVLLWARLPFLLY